MNLEKCSKFLKDLREKNGLSQEELANKLFVTRQAVSSWENGKNYPHLETLKLMTELFKVNLADLFLGEEIKDKKKGNEVIYNTIKKEQNKSKKIFIFLGTIILILLISFFLYYFINTYRRTNIYRIGTSDSGYVVKGLFINTKQENYLQVTISNTDIKELSLYYKDKAIDTFDSNVISFQESYGYNEYYSYEKDFIDNLTLKVTLNDDSVKDIKLTLVKDFENKDLIFGKTESIVDEASHSHEYVSPKVPQKIKEEFKEGKGNYNLEITEKDKKISILYDADATLFWISEEQNNNLKEFQYYGYNASYNYTEFDTNKKVNEFTSFDDIDQEKQKIVDYYMNKYVNKYMK